MTMKLTLRYYGDPVLREDGRAVDRFDDDLQAFARAMLDSMHEANGIGLAAQQVGDTRLVCVLDIPGEADLDEDGNPNNPGVDMPLVLVNPEITERSDERDTADEGCLSFPDISIPVTRPSRVSLTYRDSHGAPCRLEARGLLARAIQHEVDHLHGVLFIDYATHVKKIALKGRLKRLRRETEEQLGLAART